MSPSWDCIIFFSKIVTGLPLSPALYKIKYFTCQQDKIGFACIHGIWINLAQ